MLLECVPNISEGRCIETLDYIAAELSKIDGAALLHKDSGYDANRSVFTLAGSPAGIKRAVVRLAELCVEKIDMSRYEGRHPCIGSLDVCPLIPLQGISMEDCVRIAEELAETLSQRFEVPIYLYEEAARLAFRKSLGVIRRGGYAELESKLSSPEWTPDYGPSVPHPSQGAWVFGARPLLIAFNVNLSTDSVEVASRIASRIRTSGQRSKHRLPALRAIGWLMPEFGCAQVSCNLPDYTICGLKEVYDAISYQAEKEGCSVVGSEPIGLLPEDALKQVFRGMSSAEMALPADWLDRVTEYLGLDAVSSFHAEERILERVLLGKGWNIANPV